MGGDDCSTGTPDPLIVIKWKEIYDTLEKTLDHMEDAGQRSGIHLHQARLSMDHNVHVRHRDRRGRAASSISSTAFTTAPIPSPRWSPPGS